MKKIVTENYIKKASDFKRQPGSFPDENLSGQTDIYINRTEKKDCKKCRRKGLDTIDKKVTNTDYQTGIKYPVVERRQTGML